MKRLISILVVLTLMVLILCGCAAKTDTEPLTEAAAPATEATDAPTEATDAPVADDALHITFRVTHDDGELKEFELATTKSTLGEVLVDENLVSESDYSPGFYDTVDGEVANWDVEEGWWCFYCNGEALMVGIEEEQLVDGAVYEAVFTHGFG